MSYCRHNRGLGITIRTYNQTDFFRRIIEPYDDPYWSDSEGSADLVQVRGTRLWKIRWEPSESSTISLSEPMTLRLALARMKLGLIKP